MGSPVFSIGTTLANLSSFGNIPSLNDLLSKKVNGAINLHSALEFFSDRNILMYNVYWYVTPILLTSRGRVQLYTIGLTYRPHTSIQYINYRYA